MNERDKVLATRLNVLGGQMVRAARLAGGMTAPISDTPETDARRAGRDAGSLDKTPLEGMTDLARKLERERNEARAALAGVRADAERYRWLRSGEIAGWADEVRLIEMALRAPDPATVTVTGRDNVTGCGCG